MRLLLSIAALGAACSSNPSPESKAKADEAPKVEAPAEAAAAATPTAEDGKTPPTLSEEDKRLIAMDPKDLTPEMRRKRAYAMRRKIMQNPDSPTARTLQDLADAYNRGEIDQNGAMPSFSLPGTTPEGGAPPAGARESKPTPPEQAPPQ